MTQPYQNEETPLARPGTSGARENNLEKAVNLIVSTGCEEAASETGPDGQGALPVFLTIYRSPEPLSKAFALDESDNVMKTPAAAMSAGEARRVAIEFEQFGALLEKTDERTAVGFGLHDSSVFGESVKLTIAQKADPSKKVIARTKEYFKYQDGPGIIMLDFDPSPDGMIVNQEELRRILAEVFQGFSDAACLVRNSLSAGVHKLGEEPKAGRGFHIYVPVLCASDIPRFGRVLFRRLWLNNYGYIAISSAGSFLVRSLIDESVFAPERLDFVGKPVIGEGLEYSPPQAVFFPGGFLDTSALPDLDEREESQFKALVAQAKTTREADRKTQRAAWEETHVKILMARGVLEPSARAQTKQIRADGKPGDLGPDWVLEFKTLGSATVAEVLANPARFDNAPMADPVEGKNYGISTACFYANKGGKPFIHSFAHGGARYFLKATTGPEPRHEEPPFDPAYYEQLAPMADQAGALIDDMPPVGQAPRREDKPKPKPNSRDDSGPEQEPPNNGDASRPEQPNSGKESDVWADPILFGSKAETPEISADLLPGIFGEYADLLSQNLQTPPALAVMTVLSVLSTTLARKVVIGPYEDDGYNEPVNVWTLAVAESGERKSQVLGRCTRPLVYWEKERTRLEKAELEEAASMRKVAERRADKLEGEAAKEDDPARRESLTKEAAALRAEQPEEKHPTQIFTGDATPEAAQELLVKGGGRMGFISDEGGLLLVMAGVYGGGEAVLDVFLQGYSGNDVRVNRRCRSAIIDRPAVTLGLSIQPGILSDFPQAAKRKFRASGLFARFFPVFPRSNIGRRDVRRRASVPDELQRAYDRAVMDLLDFEPDGDEPVRLVLDADALELWHGFAEEIEAGQAEGGVYQDIRDWAAKLPGGVLRLAGLFHMARHGKDGASLAVGMESLSAAVGLALRLIEHARAVFGLVGADKTTDDAKAVWSWIEQNKLKGFLRSEAHHKFTSRFGKVEDLEQAIGVLAGRELVHGPFKSKAGKGRPTVGYTVNPRAFG